MKTVAVREAEAQFAAILREVENGETIIVIRVGHPVARLSPMGEERRGVAEAVETLRRYRREQPSVLDGISMRDLIEDGRRRASLSSTLPSR